MDQNKIGEFIAQCRKEHNMTQMQFAEKLGVTNKAVSKWETGKCLPDAALFDDICMLLNITLNELFAGERIAPENIEKKSEENLIGIATELQKKDHKIVLLKYFTAIIALVASATSISVGGISFEGTPVFSNLLLTILFIIVLIVGLLMVLLPSKAIKNLVNQNGVLVVLRLLGIIMCVASSVTIYALVAGKIVLPLIK